tara:strand:- start:142 stop:327 length:186 start_codon:yes stop_codon:yes gene_type:complete
LQEIQEFIPAAPAKFPARQSSQVETAVAAVAELAFPVAHSSQVEGEEAEVVSLRRAKRGAF